MNFSPRNLLEAFNLKMKKKEEASCELSSTFWEIVLIYFFPLTDSMLFSAKV